MGRLRDYRSRMTEADYMPLTPEERKKLEDAHDFLFATKYPGRPSRAERLDDMLTNRQVIRRINAAILKAAALVAALSTLGAIASNLWTIR